MATDHRAPGGRAAQTARDVDFPIALRGYDRAAVDQYVEEVNRAIAELEISSSPQSAIRHALEQVSEETSGLLQRAHETADEIASRSRSQAEGRLQRAEREAEILRRQADEYSEKVVVDTRLLWDERQRLLDDLRQLADEVLATADDAAERVSLPDQLAEPEEHGVPEQLGPAEPDDLTDQPTTEVELDVLPGGADVDEPDTIGRDDEATVRAEDFDTEPGRPRAE
jgi:DivIVA domain-containing protein